MTLVMMMGLAITAEGVEDHSPLLAAHGVVVVAHGVGGLVSRL